MKTKISCEEARFRVTLKNIETAIDGIIRMKTNNFPKPGDIKGLYEFLYVMLVRQGKDILNEKKWSLNMPWTKQLPPDWKKAFTKAFKLRHAEMKELLAGNGS